MRNYRNVTAALVGGGSLALGGCTGLAPPRYYYPPQVFYAPPPYAALPAPRAYTPMPQGGFPDPVPPRQQQQPEISRAGDTPAAPAVIRGYCVGWWRICHFPGS